MERLCVVVLTLLLVAGCAPELDKLRSQAVQEPTAENYMALGVQQLKNKRYEDAVGSFKHAVQLDPSSHRAHHNLAVAYVRLGQNRKALNEFRLSHRLKPEYQKLLLPMTPPGSPSDTKTLEELQQAVASGTGSVEASFALAQGYQRAKLLEEAINQYEQVIASSPRHAGAHYGLGSAYAQMGRYDDSIESLLQTIHLKPTWATPHYTLGVVYLLRGDVEEAFREYQALRQIDVRLAETLFAKIYE